jgi:branched-chain amino acid transport system ATP-binding protein
MSEGTLSVQGLQVRFGQVRVLEDVTLTVAPGQVVGLVGPNGAGKTTTLRAISGIAARNAGTVRLGSRELPQRPDGVALAGVAHVPEGRRLISSLSVERNLRLAAVAVGQKFGSEQIDYVAAIFPVLRNLLKKDAGLLSGGEQQMVAVARGLVAQPRVLMVDELSLGLSPKIVDDLLRALDKIARERNIGLLLVDQNVRALAEMCDSIYVLNHGRSVLSDKNDDSLIRDVYFGHADSAGRERDRASDSLPATAK